jgi:hypothetical protein
MSQQTPLYNGFMLINRKKWAVQRSFVSQDCIGFKIQESLSYFKAMFSLICAGFTPSVVLVVMCVGTQ